SSISPLVVRSGRDQGKVTQPSDLWTGTLYIPAAFLPQPTAVWYMKIPNKKYPQGLNSIINIVGLMRTAVERNKFADGSSTTSRLAVWIRKLKKMKIVGGMVFAEPSVSPLIKTLKGDALMERKEMIMGAVIAHNRGEWYTPTGEIEDQIMHVHRNWKTVKIENQKIIKAASHKTAPPQQHQYQSSPAPNSDPMVPGSSTTMSQSCTTPSDYDQGVATMPQLGEPLVTNMGSQHSQFTGISTVQRADGGRSINPNPSLGPGFHDHFPSTYPPHRVDGFTHGPATGFHEHVPHWTDVIPFYDGNHFVGHQVIPEFLPGGLPNDAGTIHAL
ncbi:hypothetical protein H0H93_008548, partial [Arthromyces matolae]